LKKTILYTLLNTALLLGAVGCRKDTEVFRDYANSLADLEFLMIQVPDNSRTTTFVLTTGGIVIPDTILTTTGGVRIFLTDTEALFGSGTSATPLPVSQCQSLRIEVTEVFNLGDFLARGLSNIDASGNLLETVAAVKLRIRCDNQYVSILPDRYIKIQVPAANLLPGMHVYGGVENTAGDLVWNDVSDAVFWADWPGATGTQTGYELLLHDLEWSSCQRPLGAANSTFCAILDAPFSPENTRAFLLFDHVKTAVELVADQNGNFCAMQVPSGYPVRVVTVSKTGTQYWIGDQSTETGTNSMVPVVPQMKTEFQALNFLKGL
jgi:hypothetical protein